jgi:hypothetical protein
METRRRNWNCRKVQTKMHEVKKSDLKYCRTNVWKRPGFRAQLNVPDLFRLCTEFVHWAHPTTEGLISVKIEIFWKNIANLKCFLAMNRSRQQKNTSTVWTREKMQNGTHSHAHMAFVIRDTGAGHKHLTLVSRAFLASLASLVAPVSPIWPVSPISLVSLLGETGATREAREARKARETRVRCLCPAPVSRITKAMCACECVPFCIFSRVHTVEVFFCWRDRFIARKHFRLAIFFQNISIFTLMSPSVVGCAQCTNSVHNRNRSGTFSCARKPGLFQTLVLQYFRSLFFTSCILVCTFLQFQFRLLVSIHFQRC